MKGASISRDIGPIRSGGEEWPFTLVDALPVMIWSAGPENLRDYFNRQWQVFRGRTIEQEAGRGWMEGIHADDLPAVQNLMEDCVGRRVSFEMEYRLLRQDGEYRWVRERDMPRFSPAGGFLGYLGACEDIHDQKAESQRLREANEALRRQNDELNRFAYALSHDMQEPLRTISLYSEMLASRTGPMHRADPGVLTAAIQAGAQRLHALIQGLLSYSYLGHHSELEFSQVDCNEVMAHVVLACGAAIQESHAVVTFDPLPTIRADRGRLEHLLQNLVSNAIKYRRLEDPPRIHITSTEGPEEWLFQVADNGMGFDPCYAEQIFEPLKRLNGWHESGGAGIGLALCRRIVERHGGRIWATSVPGRGSRFTFTLRRP